MKIFLFTFILILLHVYPGRNVSSLPLDKPKSNSLPLAPKHNWKGMKHATSPVVEHKMLGGLVGEWLTTAKFWDSSGSKPNVHTGSASHKWILGKRFVEEKYFGHWMGEPFEGRGIRGYDKTKDSYTSIWMDTTGTSITISEGKYCFECDAIKMQTNFSGPHADALSEGRTIITYVNKNEYLFEMYGPDPAGNEMKMMEIAYKRKEN